MEKNQIRTKKTNNIEKVISLLPDKLDRIPIMKEAVKNMIKKSIRNAMVLSNAVAVSNSMETFCEVFISIFPI